MSTKAPTIEFPSENPEEAQLSELSGIWLRFHLLAIDPLQLSAYKGSTFHGAFGWALRRMYRPLYDLLYEPASTMLPAGETARMALPKPFVLVPPLETQCEYPPGSRLSCDLLLIGPDPEFLGHYLGDRRPSQHGLAQKSAQPSSCP